MNLVLSDDLETVKKDDPIYDKYKALHLPYSECSGYQHEYYEDQN